MIKLFETEDGSHSLYSEEFQVSYHSKFGAIQETKHVFIDAGLKYKAVLKKELKVLDIGFGTGLNAFMTLIEAEKKGLQIDYTGVEAFPVDWETAQKLNYPELTGNPEKLDVFHKLHEDNWGETIKYTDTFTGTKLKQKFQDLNFDSQFDIIYFDAFAPGSQPELWEADVMQIMHKALVKGGILVTYCAKGDVKRTLKAIGFEVEKLLGPPGKREMTRAMK
jgi:tRNA U34 5-methylaminomethyl-2-thiouridine-forming methyltransferase MnmC